MDQIAKEGMKDVPEDVIKVLEGDAEGLFNAAIRFLIKLQGLIKEVKETEVKMHQIKITLGNVAQIMQNVNINFQIIIQQQYIFEQQVNSFLGRTINFAWVDNKGNIIFTTETKARELVYGKAGRSTDSRKRYVGKINVNSAFFQGESFSTNDISIFKEFSDEYKETVRRRIEKHQDLFQIILKRFFKNSKGNFWTKKDPSRKKTYYWVVGTDQLYPENKKATNRWAKAHEENRIKWSPQTSPGFLKQSHVNFIFNTLQDPSLTQSGISIWHQTFQEKESIPAIQQGDIIVGGTGQTFQIAVKSDKIFNTASIGPYIRAAYLIISFKNNLKDLSIEKVEGILNDVGPYSKSINEEVENIVKETIQSQISKTKIKS